MSSFTGSLKPAFADREVPYISYGTSFPEATEQIVTKTFNASQVFIIASRSLSSQTDALKRLEEALGPKVVGIRIGISPHTPWSELVEIINTARPLNPDCIVTLGAGSITDGSKIIAWALANNVSTTDDLAQMWSHSPNAKKHGDWKPPTIRVIAIPTSLSGGEYQSIAGGTNDKTNEKCLFEPPTKNPAVVVLDPDLTTTTPQKIWLSTGVRAVDHCVETLCSLQSNEAGDHAAEQGLQGLIPALLRCKRDPRDLDARFRCQMNVIHAMNATGSGVPLGASHAIGHQLGPLGVGHGETSCIMLPAVCKWNEIQEANIERQKNCAEILRRDQEMQKLLKEEGKNGSEVDLGDILDMVIRALDMPRTLKDVGIGRDKLDMLAENTLKDHWAKTNAKPLTEKSQVMEILEMVLQ